MSLFISRGDDTWQHTMQQLAMRRDRSLARLASGRRIGSAADDAAGLAIARRLEAQERGLAQGERNLGDGQSLVRTADAALQQSQDNLARMRELAIQAGNGTLSAGDRQAIQAEYDQLSAQLDQTAGGTSFAGRSLLDGSAGGGDAIGITDGQGGTASVDLPDAGAAALGVAGQAVGSSTTVTAIDGAADRLAQLRAQLGAADSSFASHQQQLAVARSNSAEARSRIEDADIAAEVAARIRDRILMGLQLAGLRFGSVSAGRVLDLLG